MSGRRSLQLSGSHSSEFTSQPGSPYTTGGGGRWAQVPRAITHPWPNLRPAMRSVRPMKTTNITGLFGKELK